MQYPESTSVAVEQAWSKPGSLKPRGGHHLEPQGFKGLFVSGTVGHFIVRSCNVASPPIGVIRSHRRHSLVTSGCSAPAGALISQERFRWLT